MINKKTKGHRQPVSLILAIMLMMVLMVPSFASDETGAVDQSVDEAVEETVNGTDEEPTETFPAEAPENEPGKEREKENENENEEVPDYTNTNDTDALQVKEENTVEDAGYTGAGDAEAETSVEKKEMIPQKKTLNAKAAGAKAAGDKKVSYTGSKVGSAAGETTVFKVTSDGTKYTGTCAKQGVTMGTSGTATITKISNSTKIAKVIYHFAIDLGDSNWWTSDHKTDKVGTILGMASNDATNVTKRRMVEAFCQIYNMGASDWYKTITNASTGGWTKDTADKVRDYYADINNKTWYKNLTVPDGFEIWLADAGNAQPFIIWAYTPPTPPAPSTPTGFVTMKKVSGNTSITG